MALEYCDMYSGLFTNLRSLQIDDRPAVPTSWRKCNKEEAIQAVRKLINTKAKNLSLPSFTDDFILRFLHARKMNVDNAFQLIMNYSNFRRTNPTLFDNLSVKDEGIRNALHDGLPLILKNYDRKGRRILHFLLYQWDFSKYSLETIYRSLVLTMEYLLGDLQNQYQGFVFIVDWTNFRLRDYFELSPKMMKFMIDGFQDSFPARIKGVHFVGQPWYIEGFLAVMKPFLKETTRDKLVIHGSNLSTLHEYVPRDVVPSDLGGEGNVFKPDEWIKKLEKFEES